MHRRTSLFCVGLVAIATGCPTRDISKLDPAPAIEYRQDIPVSTNRNVDILFVIDNSDSMKEEQQSLTKNFPRFIDVLKSIEGGLPNVHIGVVSSDVGIPPFMAEQCENDGQNGLLQNTAHPATGMSTCPVPLSGARFIEDIAVGTSGARQQNYVAGQLDATFSCIANLGVTGCGIEQHLESMKRALDGSRPENSGFLRSDAYLAIIILADEDDCSAFDNQVFNPSSMFDTLTSEYGPFASYRCTEFGITCDGATLPRVAGDYTTCVPRTDSPFLRHPNEYVNFLRQVKSGDPNLLITAVIAGPPRPVGVTLTDTGAPKLKPACSSNNGKADPGVRLKFFGDQQGVQNTFVSICQDDLSDAMNQVALLLKKVLGTLCIAGDLDTDDIDPGTPGTQINCQVSDVTFPGQPGSVDRPMARCAMTDATTPVTSVTPCWWTRENTVKCTAQDSPTRTELVIERGGGEPSIGTHVVANCLIKE